MKARDTFYVRRGAPRSRAMPAVFGVLIQPGTFGFGYSDPHYFESVEAALEAEAGVSFHVSKPQAHRITVIQRREWTNGYGVLIASHEAVVWPVPNAIAVLALEAIPTKPDATLTGPRVEGAEV